MRLYISLKQHKALQALIDVEAQNYELNRDPNIIHKFTAYAFIQTNVTIHFHNHKPMTFSYQNYPLGSVTSEQQTDTDVEWVISSRNFQLFVKNCSDFDLEYGNFSDGCSHTQTAKVMMDFSIVD